jgi:hypothetical protein
MPRARHAFAVAFLGLALASVTTGVREARADSASGSCSLSGTATMPVDLPIYDKSEGGSPIARFTGSSSALVTSDFFPGGRVKIKTGTGTGSFNIGGYIQASKLPLFTKNKVSVIGGHLWISAHRAVSVVSAGSNKLRIKRHVGTPFDQDFTAWAPCSSLTFGAGTPAGWSPPGQAQGYVAKNNVEIYDGSGSDKSLVTILTPASGSNGILLWSVEHVGTWVHLEHHSDVEINGWARRSDLHELAPGETMDQPASSSTVQSPAHLALAQPPREVRTTKEIPIRDSASDSGSLIGHIESDTDVYVLDTVAGWSSVLPKALNVAPHGDNQFWVKGSDL